MPQAARKHLLAVAEIVAVLLEEPEIQRLEHAMKHLNLSAPKITFCVAERTSSPRAGEVKT